MLTEGLGDKIEALYRSVYEGRSNRFSLFLCDLMSILEEATEDGKITYNTRDKIEIFLMEDIDIFNMEIISKDTGDICVLNKITHEKDTFKLNELITFVTNILCDDYILNKLIGENCSYMGVKKILNVPRDKSKMIINDKSWIDFCICNNAVFFTKIIDGNIRLFAKTLEMERGVLTNIARESKEIEIIKDNLLNGRIYYDKNNKVFVETEDLSIVDIKVKEVIEGNAFAFQKFEGRIIEQLKNGKIIYVKDDELFSLDSVGVTNFITENVYCGVVCVGDKEVYWRNIFRKTDKEAYIFSMTNVDAEYGNKEEKLYREILWKTLILNLYDFNRTTLKNKIGSRIRFSQILDLIPLPFTYKEICLRLSEIEKNCYDNSFMKKSNSYVEIMTFLMSKENCAACDKENDTIKGLGELFELIEKNPYLKLGGEGIEIVNIYSYIFGKDVFFEHRIKRGDIKVVNLDNSLLMQPNERNNKKLSELIERIDKKIAELEEMDEEENKNKGKNKKKKRKGKRKNKKNKEKKNGASEKEKKDSKGE